MDIVHLRYFIYIVECDYNLSLAAKKIHISQPALSQFIANFEKQNHVKLFERKNGRLKSLTSAGVQIYQYALEITDLYEELEESIRIEGLKEKGTVRLGVPSMILSVYLSDYLPSLSIDNEGIHIETIDGSSNDIRKMLINKELDIAILIDPSTIDKTAYEQHMLERDDIVAFINRKHPLADKVYLDWEDIKGYPVATFNKNFVTYELVYEKMAEYGMENQIKFTSSAWDYLIESTRDSDIITILPKPVIKYIDRDSVHTYKRFRETLPFNFRICRPSKETYNHGENFVYQSIIEEFGN